MGEIECTANELCAANYRKMERMLEEKYAQGWVLKEFNEQELIFEKSSPQAVCCRIDETIREPRENVPDRIISCSRPNELPFADEILYIQHWKKCGYCYKGRKGAFYCFLRPAMSYMEKRQRMEQARTNLLSYEKLLKTSRHKLLFILVVVIFCMLMSLWVIQSDSVLAEMASIGYALTAVLFTLTGSRILITYDRLKEKKRQEEEIIQELTP